MALEDSYWEKSNCEGFNFNDTESSDTQVYGFSLVSTEKLSQQIKAGLGTDILDINLSNVQDEVPVQPKLLEQLSEKVLRTLLEADNAKQSCQSESANSEVLQVQERSSPPEISLLLKRIVTGQPYSFEFYRSLKSKKELLKNAVSLGDGDTILMVVLFLSNTLKKTLFYQILSTSPVAVQHYVTYLSTRMQVQEVTDLLEMLGHLKEASMKYYEFACSNPQRQLNRLKSCSRNHFNDMKEKLVVDKFIRLLEWQESCGISLGESVAASLEHACKNQWDSKGPSSPFHLVQDQNVSERLFQWIALNVKASTGLWPDIDSIFITKGWLGNKRVKTELPMEEVVLRLHELKAPQAFLKMYLDLIDNLEKRLVLAKRVQCHRTVIDVFVSQRDRLSISKYKASLEPQSEEFIIAEQALKTPTVKWKN